MSSSKVLDHFLLIRGEPANSPRYSIGDYDDQYSLDRSYRPQPLLERRQKDLGPDNPHYHWDWIDPRLYE